MTRTTTVERFRHFNDGISQSGMIRDGTIHRRCRRLKKPPDWRHSYVLDSSVDIYLSERFVGIRNEAYIAFDEPKWSGSLGSSLSQRHPLLWVNIMRKRNDLLEYRKNKDGRKWRGEQNYWKHIGKKLDLIAVDILWGPHIMTERTTPYVGGLLGPWSASQSYGRVLSWRTLPPARWPSIKDPRRLASRL